MADVTKSKKVTFSEGLPRGTVGTFTHDGELWFAYPQPKVQAISGALDRAVGVVERVHDDLVAWINDHPEDAVRVVAIVGKTAAFKQLALEKVQAWTMRERQGVEESAQEQAQEEGPTDSAGGDTGEVGAGA